MKKRIVIKLGGSSLQDASTLDELSLAIRNYNRRGNEVVIVHGGGPNINKELTERGITWKFIDGQRQTTPEMMTVINDVLATKVNSMIVKHLKNSDLHAKGLSGAQEKILNCVASSPELMQVGEVTSVDPTSIEKTLSQGEIPVIAPIGLGEDSLFNINADWAASKIASALGAKRLIFLTDQNGILDGEKKLFRSVSPTLIKKLIQTEVISGGMRTKTLAMIDALESGVEKVQVLNARFASQLGTRMKTGTVLKENQHTNTKEVIHGRAI